MTHHSAPLVLVVEDEPNPSEMLEAYLRRDGFRTERAADGENALRLFREAKPDFVLLDVALLKVDGFEILRQVRGSAIPRSSCSRLGSRTSTVSSVCGWGPTAT